MLKITNQNVLQAVLQYILTSIEANPAALDEFIVGGVDPRLLDLLRSSSAREFIELSKTKFSVGIEIDSVAILTALQKTDAIRNNEILSEYFIVHGASTELISEYFKYTEKEVQALRELLNTDEAKSAGRPKLPPLKERAEICDAWGKLQKTDPAVHAKHLLQQLHQTYPQYTINSLVLVLKEFDANALAAKRSPGAVAG
jgi:hypothetical protein